MALHPGLQAYKAGLSKILSQSPTTDPRPYNAQRPSGIRPHARRPAKAYAARVSRPLYSFITPVHYCMFFGLSINETEASVH